jgi:hypothetical protein
MSIFPSSRDHPDTICQAERVTVKMVGLQVPMGEANSCSSNDPIGLVPDLALPDLIY